MKMSFNNIYLINLALKLAHKLLYYFAVNINL